MNGRFISVALSVVGLSSLSLVVHVLPSAADGYSGASLACQQGGYAHLTGVDTSGQTITFATVGECVSYAAQGGQFTTCADTSTTGCIGLDNVDVDPGAKPTTLTLAGAFSFDATCTTLWCEYGTPNALALGGGVYIETDGAGTVVSHGAFRIADTSGTSEGLTAAGFSSPAGHGSLIPAPCSSALGYRTVVVLATFIPADKKSSAFTKEIGVGTSGSFSAVWVSSNDVRPFDWLTPYSTNNSISFSC